MLRGASAGTRHMVWTGAVIALLVLPVLDAVVPRLEVAAGGALRPIAERVETPQVVGADEFRVTAGPVDGVPEIFTGAESVGPSISSLAEPSAAMAADGEAARQWRFDPWRSIAVVWVVGAIVLLLRLAIGLLGVRRLERGATEVTDPEWAQLLHDARWLLDVEKPVRLLRSESASIPVTWGTLRPAVLLPADADTWSLDRKRVVLLHEVAHIARRDCFTQLLAGIAAAIHWIHPLAWVAARRLRVERERACDDLVLAAGERASEYAAHLLDVARRFRPAPAVGVAAIAMARPSQLEGRLLALLDDARNRRIPGRRARLIGGAAAVVALIPLSAVTVVEARQGDPASSSLVEGLAGLSQASVNPEIRPVASAAAEAAPVAAPVPLRAPADSTIELRVPADFRETVYFDLDSGANLRVVGWDRNEVFVRGWLRGREVDRMRVELDEMADGVRLRSRYVGRPDSSNDHEFEVYVPAQSKIELDSRGGSFVAESITGAFRGRTGGGKVVLDRLAGEVDLQTGGGSVEVVNSNLDGEVATGGGTVTLDRVMGGLRAATGGGNIRLTQSTEGAGGRPLSYRTGGGHIQVDRVTSHVDLTTGGGNITVDYAGAGVEAHTGGGAIRIGQVLGSVEARTGGGEVRIERASGSVDVNAGSGSIAVGVAPGIRDAEIELNSADGSVMLVLPSDFSGTFEVVGPTYRRDWLESDFDLTLEEGRATGQVGDGRNRVRIRAIGGNITIRRGDGLARADRQAGPRTVINDNVSVNEVVSVNKDVAVIENVDFTLEELAALERLEDLDFDVGADVWSNHAVEAAMRIAKAAAQAGLNAAITSIEALDFEIDPK